MYFNNVSKSDAKQLLNKDEFTSYSIFNNINATTGKYDIYIAGSDQIWDYKLTNFDQTYFLDFPEKGKKKCSYAASIGEHIPPEQFRNDYSRLLNDFDEILVREDYGADIVNELTGKKPEVVCDPTLLLTAEEWNKLLKEPKIRGKYILVYQLGINPEIVNFAKRLKKKTGYRIVYIPFPLVGLLKCRCEITVGPAEWMGLFKNAEYVISDSFHGVVFSLLFNRKFFAKADGHHKNRRVEQLLKLVNLSDRTMNDVSDEQLTEEIDFTYANEQIANFRNFSLHKLSEMVK